MDKSKQTAVEWVYKLSKEREPDKFDWEQAKKMEKEQIKNAVMFGLDEDGHTGDWKMSVTESYYNKTYNNGNSNTNI